MNSLLWQQNVFATVICVLFCFVIRDRPVHPPSLVALKQQEDENFCEMLLNAIKNKQFVLIMLIFGCLDGVFIGIGVVLDPFFKALGFGTSQISALGGIFVICGVLSALVIGYVLDKTSKYLITMRSICISSTLLFIVGYASFASGNIYIVGANIVLDGFALVPFLPVCIAFAAEVTFPMQEAVVVGIL